MKILLIGASGFIGTYIFKQLHEQGISCCAFDISQPSTIIEDYTNSDNWIVGDIRDAEHIERVVADFRPSAIINMAGLMYWGTRENPRLALEVHLLGYSNVLEAARKNAVKRVVTASSAAVYEGTSDSWDESAKISPAVSLYGACKFLNEILGQQYQSNYALETCALRCGTVYGPGQIASSGIANEIKKIESIASGNNVTVELSATDLFFPLYVEDAARAFILAATQQQPVGPIYNIGVSYKEAISMESFVLAIKRAAPQSGNVTFAVGDRSVDVSENQLSTFDITKASKELGFRPVFSLEAGIEACINYHKVIMDNPA